MDEAAFDAYRNGDVTAEEAVVSVGDVAGPDRTLMLGFDVDRTNVHVYLRNGLLVVVRYWGARGERGVASAKASSSLPASMLLPSKRAFPERTDELFAAVMRAKGRALPFARYELARASCAQFAGVVVDGD